MEKCGKIVYRLDVIVMNLHKTYDCLLKTPPKGRPNANSYLLGTDFLEGSHLKTFLSGSAKRTEIQ